MNLMMRVQCRGLESLARPSLVLATPGRSWMGPQPFLHARHSSSSKSTPPDFAFAFEYATALSQSRSNAEYMLVSMESLSAALPLSLAPQSLSVSSTPAGSRSSYSPMAAASTNLKESMISRRSLVSRSIPPNSYRVIRPSQS